LLRDQRRGWDHLEVLLSLVYRLLRCLFGLLAVLVRSDLSKDVELLVLRHENQALRRQAGGRPRWDHTDRLWLTALSQQVNRRRWSDIFPVTPATILRWHRDLVAAHRRIDAGASPGWAELAAVPGRPGARDSRVRFPGGVDGAAQTVVRAGVHRARNTKNAPGRSDRAPEWGVGGAAGPAIWPWTWVIGPARSGS
jgi:hypothetical protein